jgi:hypothetical protein
MSELQVESASMIQPPVHLNRVIDELEILEALRNSGTADRPIEELGSQERIGDFQAERTVGVDERLIYVDMNDTLRVRLQPEQEALIATSSLGGCTGVAGFAEYSDGSALQFVSHWVPGHISYDFQGAPWAASVAQDIEHFDYAASKGIPVEAVYLIAYPKEEHHDSRFGKRSGLFASWHPVDQLQVKAEQLAPSSRVLYFPYYNGESGHTLAAGRRDGTSGIFWNGMHVDYDAYFSVSQNVSNE